MYINILSIIWIISKNDENFVLTNKYIITHFIAKSKKLMNRTPRRASFKQESTNKGSRFNRRKQGTHYSRSISSSRSSTGRWNRKNRGHKHFRGSRGSRGGKFSFKSRKSFNKGSKKFYAVLSDTNPIFTDWKAAKKYIDEFNILKYKSFSTHEAAKIWLDAGGKTSKTCKFYAVLFSKPVRMRGDRYPKNPIFKEWKRCQLYMKNVQKYIKGRLKYKSFPSEAEAKSWLSTGGHIYKSAKSLDRDKPMHVSLRTHIIQRLKLFPQGILDDLIKNKQDMKNLRGRGNFLITKGMTDGTEQDPMNYTALMGSFIDFMTTREFHIQTKTSFEAKSVKLSLLIARPDMVKFNRDIELRVPISSKLSELLSEMKTDPKPTSEESTSEESTSEESTSSSMKELPISKKIVGRGLDRDLLHTYDQKISESFNNLISDVKKALAKVQDLSIPNEEVITECLFLTQFQGIARKERYHPKDVTLNNKAVLGVINEIKKMITFVLIQEKDNHVVINPDLSSQRTIAEADFLSGNTLFDVKCLFSVVAPIKSIERSLIQYIQYAALISDPNNELNKIYKPIKQIVILLPLQMKTLVFNIEKLPLSHIREIYCL